MFKRRIGLTGPHRCGKTTLAEAFVKANPEYVLVRSGISNAFASRGLTPQSKIPFETRLDIQIDLLELQDKAFKEAGSTFITDRTPLDLIAYTLAEINGDAARQLQDSKALSGRLSGYLSRCASVAYNNLDRVVVVSDLPSLTPDPTKGASSRFYCDKIRTLLNETFINFQESSSNPPVMDMSNELTDLGGRVAYLNRLNNFLSL
jgi:hypothetical protein